MSASEIIRQARLEAAISQASLARRAGTSQAAISRLERGVEEPTLARVQELLACLGWRLETGLEPLAEHDAEPRRLIEQAQKSPQARFEEGLAWADFMRELDLAGRKARATHAA